MRTLAPIIFVFLGLTPAFADEARPRPLGDVPIFREEAHAAGLDSV